VPAASPLIPCVTGVGLSVLPELAGCVTAPKPVVGPTSNQ
jgi:hypothetical protein